MTRAPCLFAPCLFALWAASASATEPKALLEGHVVQVTPARAYLDAGRAEGLTKGAQLRLWRGAAKAGTCAVEQVADHRASCTGGAARLGDRFALEQAERAAAPTLASLPQPQGAAELSRENKALTTAGLKPVEFHGGPSSGAGVAAPRAQAVYSQRSWFNSELRPWQEERVDARLGVPVGGVGFFDLEATALHLQRPDGTERFRPGQESQLYLWRAELALRSPAAGGTRLSGSLGRLIPASAPGAQRIDGAQIGYRLGGSELGLFGGAIPDAQTLAPAADRYTGGGYFALGRVGDSGSALSFAQATARVAYVRAPEWGSRYEGELSALAQLWRTVDLTASARLGLGDLQAPGALDAARVSVDLRPVSGLSLSGSFRYLGSRLPVDSTLLLVEGPTRHGELTGAFQLSQWAILGAEAGLAQDLLSSTSRSWAGPTLALPQLFGALGGLSAGYQEERGDAPGRSAWLQGSLLPSRKLQLLARASFFLDTRQSQGSDVEVSLFVRLMARLTDHLGAHLSAMGRVQPVAVGVSPSPHPYGAWLDAGISGEL